MLTSVESVRAGQVLTLDDLMQRGRISVAFIARGDNDSWVRWNWFRRSRDMYSAHIQYNRRHRELPGFFSHFVAHVLGFNHPIGRSEVPLPSVMRRDGEPTKHDILHGRILYRRPSGSRTPDTDRESFVLNGTGQRFGEASLETEVAR